tara:strand:- start:80 stop:901 length:822 start_codon:yes stop_codon:yes gene_type:complete
MKKQLLLIPSVLGLVLGVILISFGIFTFEKQDLVLDEKGSTIFFDFNDVEVDTNNGKMIEGENITNSETTVCGKICNAIEKNTSFVQGINGLAVKFETQNESWIEVPHHPSLSFGEEGGATIAFFVKVYTHSYKHNMIYNKGNVGWGHFYNPSYDGLYEGEYLAFQAIWMGDNSQEYLNTMCNDGKEIELNKWYFVVHVLESDHKTLKQYINGIEMCSDTSEKPVNTDNLDDLNLGHVEGTYNDFSQLALDNFTIFNYSLTADEILALYQKLS